jgi:hypothetical protein
MGSLRTAARRRMGTESEVADPASVDMDLHDWRRVEVEVARRTYHYQVVMLFCHRGRGGGGGMCVFGEV